MSFSLLSDEESDLPEILVELLSQPQQRSDLTEVDIVLNGSHRYNEANVLWRASIENHVKGMNAGFFSLSKSQKGEIIAQCLRDDGSKWKYWVPPSIHDSLAGYSEATQKDVVGWIQQVTQNAANKVQRGNVTRSGSGQLSSAVISRSESDVTRRSSERREASSSNSSSYATTQRGRAWLSLFDPECSEVEDTDIVDILNEDNTSTGDFSVLASRSSISDHGSEQALAKVFVILPDRDKKQFHWFYNVRDGKYYGANTRNDHSVSGPFDSFDKLLRKECRDDGILLWRFRRHDRQKHILFKIMAQAAKSANRVLEDSESGSMKRSRYSLDCSEQNSDSALSSLTHDCSQQGLSADSEGQSSIDNKKG